MRGKQKKEKHFFLHVLSLEVRSSVHMRISFVHELDSIVYSVPRSTSELEVRAFELPLLSAGSYLSSHSYSMKEEASTMIFITPWMSNVTTDSIMGRIFIFFLLRDSLLSQYVGYTFFAIGACICFFFSHRFPEQYGLASHWKDTKSCHWGIRSRQDGPKEDYCLEVV